MCTFWYFLLIFLVLWKFSLQNKYIIIQDNITLDYVDHAVLDVEAHIYKLNQTVNGLNVTLKFKIDLPEDCKAYIKAFKWMNNDYRLGLIEFGKTIKSGLDMEAFGLQSLYADYTRPALVWPLEKGIWYRCVGWSPDSAKFPPNLPDGNYKVELVFAFGNKKNFVVANWFIKVVYK